MERFLPFLLFNISAGQRAFYLATAPVALMRNIRQMVTGQK
jgi:hypothetical protein